VNVLDQPSAGDRPLPDARAYGAVPLGPQAYRSSLRRWGPVVALVPPAALGVLAAAVWAWYPCEGGDCVMPGAVALVMASAVVWMVIGAWASRRATRSPVADWRDYLRELGWLVAGVWGGVLVGLGATAVALRVIA
jgi:hypothetical protein